MGSSSETLVAIATLVGGNCATQLGTVFAAQMHCERAPLFALTSPIAKWTLAVGRHGNSDIAVYFSTSRIILCNHHFFARGAIFRTDLHLTCGHTTSRMSCGHTWNKLLNKFLKLFKFLNGYLSVFLSFSFNFVFAFLTIPDIDFGYKYRNKNVTGISLCNRFLG